MIIMEVPFAARYVNGFREGQVLAFPPDEDAHLVAGAMALYLRGIDPLIGDLEVARATCSHVEAIMSIDMLGTAQCTSSVEI